jgi:hypothetical protein
MIILYKYHPFYHNRLDSGSLIMSQLAGSIVNLLLPAFYFLLLNFYYLLLSVLHIQFWSPRSFRIIARCKPEAGELILWPEPEEHSVVG